MARKSSRSSRKSGRLALRLAVACGIAGFIGAGLTMVASIRILSAGLAADSELLPRAWMSGLVVALVATGIVAGVAWAQGGGLGARLVELGLAVSKMGRTGSEARVRLSGNDEITDLGRAIQYLGSDLEAVAAERARGGGLAVSEDAQVRALRDRTLSEMPDGIEGFETEATIAAGSRGGLDYCGCIARENGACATLFVVGVETPDAIGVFAARLARDEIVRALKANASARKVLAHTNKVLHKTLPQGACAVASLVEIDGEAGDAKLYQAGYRAPLWICSGGEVLEVEAEGLALGLDDGAVFEKGLRGERIPMATGTRVVQTNDAGVRNQEFLDLVQQHSPKHTAGFVNLVLGQLEESAEGGLREDLALVTAKRG